MDDVVRIEWIIRQMTEVIESYSKFKGTAEESSNYSEIEAARDEMACYQEAIKKFRDAAIAAIGELDRVRATIDALPSDQAPEWWDRFKQIERLLPQVIQISRE